MPVLYLYYLFISFSVTLFIMPVLFRLLEKFNVFDKPNHRKIHISKKLTGGGAILFFSFLGSFFLIFYALNVTGVSDLSINLVSSFLVGFSILFLMGFIDDKINLDPKLKFLIQIVACVLFVLISNQKVSFNFITSSDFFSFSITVFLMLSIINAFNLIDGLDGLASGIALISLVSLSLVLDSVSLNIFTYVIVGSLFAFLIKNMYPARIFLGDSGSYILGYSISVIIILISNKSDFESYKIIYLLLFIGFPAIDVSSAFLRRALAKKNIFIADKKHIHHILLNKGISHRDTVLWLYLGHFTLCVFGLILMDFHINKSILFIGVPGFFLISKYFNYQPYIDRYQNNRISQYINSISVYILSFIAIFFNIQAVDNIILTDFFEDFHFILFICLMLILFSAFIKYYKEISILLFLSIITISINVDSPTEWISILSNNMWILLFLIIVIYILTNSKRKYFLNSIEVLFFIFLIMLDFISIFEMIDTNYISKIFLLFISYKIILSDSIIYRYRLFHIINLISIICILFV